MKKQEIIDQIGNIYFLLKDKTQEQKGMTPEETKELYEKIYYIMQQGR